MSDDDEGEVTKMTVIERLEKLLNDKDIEIAKLRRAAEKYAKDQDDDAWLWSKHSESPETEGLLLPRLEIRWTPLGNSPLASGGEWNWLASYNLVYRHLLGHVIVVPISATRRGGGPGIPVRDGQVETPFRDGAHIRNEMLQLGLPGYAICGDVINRLELPKR